MFRIIYQHVNSSNQNCFNQFVKRYFLSNSYQCTEAWKNRLQNPVFQTSQAENLYFRVIQDFKAIRRIKIVEVDTFINILSDNTLSDELEDMLIKVRQTPESVLLPERSSYATVRFLIEHASAEKILNILGDRLTYGIFPDYHLSNMLMDKFLNANEIVAAVKIAVLQMQQEDVDHPITRAMALYSSYKYLASSEIWEVIHPPKEDSDDDDIIKVRLPYLRNPYFDDHFDINIPNHLVGKTLWLFGISLGGELGLSSQLVGLILYEKYDKCVELLKKCIENKSKIYSDAIAMAKNFMENKPKQAVEDNKENKNEKNGSEENIDSETSSNNNLKSEVLSLLSSINESNVINGNLLDVSKKLVEEVVSSQEEIDIKEQCEIFKKWEKEREEDLIQEAETLKKEETKLKIKELKNELILEERKLFFFDNKEEIEMLIEKQEERMKKVKHFQIKKKNDFKPEKKNYI